MSVQQTMCASLPLIAGRRHFCAQRSPGGSRTRVRHGACRPRLQAVLSTDAAWQKSPLRPVPDQFCDAARVPKRAFGGNRSACMFVIECGNYVPAEVSEINTCPVVIEWKGLPQKEPCYSHGAARVSP